MNPMGTVMVTRWSPSNKPIYERDDCSFYHTHSLILTYECADGQHVNSVFVFITITAINLKNPIRKGAVSFQPDKICCYLSLFGFTHPPGLNQL